MFLRPKNGQEAAVSALGFYSIVRYVEDVERGEPLNVGVILEVNGDTLPRRVDREQLGQANESVGRFFDLLDRLIEEGETRDPEETDDAPTILAYLSRRRFPHFEITEPRQVMVDRDPRESLEELSTRLAAESRGVLADGWFR